MTDEKHDDLVFEFLEGGLSPERERELERQLTEAGLDPEELRRLGGLYRDLDSLPAPEPSQSMTAAFYAQLEAEKGQLRAANRRPASPTKRGAGDWFSRLWPRFGYAALLVLAGWSIAYWVTPAPRYETKLEYMATEMAEMKKMMMFSMLNRTSAAERLQAVEYLQDLVAEDDQVLTAMLEVFERDPNVNVRLATLGALSLAGGNDRVREGLIRGVEREDAPVVQLALVDLVVSKRMEQAADPLRHLLERKDLNLTVRQRVREGLRLLS